MEITQFGTFTFDGVPQRYKDNFGDVMPETQRIAHPQIGGFDAFGYARAPIAPGRIEYQITLVATSEATMDAKREAIRGLYEQGYAKLYRTVGYSDLEQWCDCILTDVQYTENESNHTYIFQDVTLTWFAPDPVWESDDASSLGVWEVSTTDTWEVSSSETWEEGNNTSFAGVNTAVDINNAGSAIAFPVITVTATATITNLIIERTTTLGVVDQITYTGTLSADDVLIIDCTQDQRSVTLNGSSAYDDTSFLRLRWFQLESGVNTIAVKADNAPATGVVDFAYKARYH